MPLSTRSYLVKALHGFACCFMPVLGRAAYGSCVTAPRAAYVCGPERESRVGSNVAILVHDK